MEVQSFGVVQRFVMDMRAAGSHGGHIGEWAGSPDGKCATRSPRSVPAAVVGSVGRWTSSRIVSRAQVMAIWAWSPKGVFMLFLPSKPAVWRMHFFGALLVSSTSTHETVKITLR